MAAPRVILFLLCAIAVVVKADWVYKNGSDVCIHMTGNVSVTINNKGSQEVLEYDEWDLEGNESSCNFVSCDDSHNKDLNAQLSLSTYSTHSDAILYLYFTFTGVCKKGSQKWSLANVSVMIDPSANGTLDGTVFTSDWFSTQYTRSYLCNHATNYTKLTSNNNSVLFTTSNWQVQAFQFRYQKTGNYDNAQQCSQDSKGTMIVPIVVGIALAVLIAVVVVAYVISYVYHRKKTGSYEALN